MDELKVDAGSAAAAEGPAATADTPASEPALDAASGPSSDASAEAAATVSPGLGQRSRWRGARRFVAAFAFGLLGVFAVSAGALAAFESSNTGRIMPGVHVGTVDLSGLSPSQARAALVAAYADLADGELQLSAGDTTRSVPYDRLGRRLDVDGLVTQAMAVGRSGATLERIAANVRNLVRGVRIDPVVVIEPAALRVEIDALAAAVAVTPVDAAAAVDGDDFAVTPGTDGRTAGTDAAISAAQSALTDLTAGSTVRISLPVSTVEPTVTTAEATAAAEAARRIAVDVELRDGDETWTLAGSAIRGWISFVTTPEGGYTPVVASDGLETGLEALAAQVARAPVNASFLVGDGSQIVGVTEAVEGRALDIPGTIDQLTDAITQRAVGLSVIHVPVATTAVEPDLTTAEALETAPLMKPISEWTTYFPIGIKNGNGANIWIPANDIDGYVVGPGEWFDFWKAIGPVTRERGYKDGGAIINGKTEPQGALAGGICSCSTTLFNAALRAGLEMGARRNHYYYIDRYPLGLDATVFQSSSGSVQTMSFRNDTDAPILIRGYGWRNGSKGYVKFVLWSVPNGRTVAFSNPIVKNVKPASDTTVQTTDLKPGVKERVEYPVDGKDVWVTRTVKDAAGNVIHQETYYSHYARITGILRVGVAPPNPGPTPTPTPAALPPASPTPLPS